jgi:hypothetical protein
MRIPEYEGSGQTLAAYSPFRKQDCIHARQRSSDQRKQGQRESVYWTYVH